VASEAKYVVVTIDGPSGAGKTTVGKILAKRLNGYFLETGAVFRVMGKISLDNKMDLGKLEERSKELISATSAFFAHGFVSLDHYYGSEEIALAASCIAVEAWARRFALGVQRKMVEEHKLIVASGRDAGSVIFPNAHIKFFLTASINARAKRRYMELCRVNKGVELKVVKEYLIKRDKSDASREYGPLVIPEGAKVVDTTHSGAEKVAEILYRLTMPRIQHEVGMLF